MHSLSFRDIEMIEVLQTFPWKTKYRTLNIQYSLRPGDRYVSDYLFITSPGVGVTKAPFANFSVSKIFDLAKVPVRFPESHSYLTGVTAAELRRHLPNINAIFNS